MTTEMVKAYKRYWNTVSNQLRDAIYQEREPDVQEHLNDLYVRASDMVDICELALCQLFRNEEVKKGVIEEC